MTIAGKVLFVILFLFSIFLGDFVHTALGIEFSLFLLIMLKKYFRSMVDSVKRKHASSPSSSSPTQRPAATVDNRYLLQLFMLHV